MDLPALSGLLDGDRRRIGELLGRKWTLPADGEPLFCLQGCPLDGHRLLVLAGPKNQVGARYFQLLLANGEGRLTDGPLALGLHNRGAFPGYNWVELIKYDSSPRILGEPVDTHERKLDVALFKLLSRVVPAGGHLMVEYESPGQEATARILSLGYPPVTSPLGYLLYQAGCRSFRDWYIAEGGSEGPRKLQGFKPIDEGTARSKSQQLREEMEGLLAGPEVASHGEWGRKARELAREVLDMLVAESRGGLYDG